MRLEPPTGVVFVIGKLSVDAKGIYLRTGGDRIESPLFAIVPPPAEPVVTRPKVRRRLHALKPRTLMPPPAPEPKDCGEMDASGPAGQPSLPPLEGQNLGAFAGHIVAVCLYLARPYMGSL